MDTANILKERFIAAIKKSFPERTPLLGPKWFKAGPKGVDFQFTGCFKLAKAMGFKTKRIAGILLDNLDLADLEASVVVTEEFMINVNLPSKPKAGPDEPS